MNFIHPEILYLIPAAVALVVWFSFRGGRLRRSRLRLLLGQAAEDPEAVLLSPRKRRCRHVLLALTLSALLLAAARPYWNSDVRPTSDSGRDVLVLFDVSKSMLSTDLAPSRLEHAKFLLRQLVSADPGDSFGLVAFAGTAYLSCPLTSDRVAFEEYVKELSPDAVPIGGTNLELALRKAMDAFKAASGNNRAILLFTDGDELTGSSDKAIGELKKRGIPLFVVGLGDPSAGAPVLNEKGEARRDRTGKLISTRLNETALKKLALETGGVYVRASVTDSNLGIIEKRIASLGRSGDGEKRSRTIPVERFPLPLLAAAVFLAGFLLLSERPKVRRKLSSLLILGALLLVGAAEPDAPAAKEAPAAEKSIPISEEPVTGTPEERYNRARELQLAGDARAEKQYEALLNDSAVPPAIQSRALFNLGTGSLQSGRKSYLQAETLVQQQQLDPALKALDQAKQALAVGEDLNMRAISIPESGAYLEDFNANLKQLTLDRDRVEELRRKIEELKKQQQEAQKRTEEARQKQQQQKNQQQKQNQSQQNQQKQGQQGQQKQDQKQNQNQQQGQQQQNQQQNQQGQQQQQQQQQKQNQQTSGTVEDALKKAQQAAEQLQKKAEELGQNSLRDKAQQAKDELEKAQKDARPEPRDEHIRKAQEALGKPQEPKQNDKKDGKDNKDNKDNKDPKGKDQPKPGKDEKNQPDRRDGKAQEQPKPGENGAEQLLRMAEGEEAQFREGVRREQYRRPPVEKDW